MSLPPDCLDEETAFSYIEGQLPEERRSEIEGHARACEACRGLLEAVASVAAPEDLPCAEAPQELPAAERYTVLSEHARGGQARILLAFDEKVGREVALKELLPPSEKKADDSSWRDAMARFLREAELTGQLAHPGVVPVFDIGQRPDGSLFYTMQLVRGRTLGEILREQPRLQDRLGLLSHFLTVCHVVAYAHSRGIVHRDIKPQNVMVGEFGETVLLDWGLAKQQDDRPAAVAIVPQSIPSDPTATLDGTIVGTPGYMSPEQASGQLTEVDERSDVYGLGAVLFEILTGEPPPIPPLQELTLRRGRRGPSIRELCREAPGELAAVADKALAMEKQDRYENASDLAREVAAFMTGGKVAAYSYSWRDLARRFASRHRLLLGSGVAILAVILSAVVLLAIAWRSERVSRQGAEASREEATARGRDALQEGAKLALSQGDVLQARAKLRGALELGDSLTARALWRKLRSSPERFVTHFSSSTYKAAFSPDGRMLAVGLQSASIQILDVVTGATVHALRSADDDQIAAVAYGPRGLLASAALSGRIAVWDPLNGATAFLGQDEAAVRDIAFSPDGSLLASASARGEVVLWDIAEKSVRARLPMPGRRISAVAFDSKGRRLAASGRDGKAAIWDPATSTMALALPLALQAVAFNRDGSLIAGGGFDGNVYLMSGESGEILRVIRGGEPHGAMVAISSDSRLLASISGDGTVRVWDLPNGNLQRVFATQLGAVYGVAFGPDSSLLAATSGSSAWVWDLSMPKAEREPVLPSFKDTPFVKFTPDGDRVASLASNGVVRMWEAATGELRASWPGHEAYGTGLCFSQDGGLLATIGEEGTLIARNPKDGSLLRRIVSGDRLRAVACAPDGKTVATSGRDNIIRIWDARSGKLVRLLEPIGSTTSAIRSLLYLPDGRRLAAGRYSGVVEVWDLTLGQISRLLTGHTDSVPGLAIDARGERLASASVDRSVRLWNLADGTSRVLGPVSGRAYGLGWDHEAGRIAVALSTGEITVWGLDGDRRLSFPAHRSEVNAVDFAPDGRSAVSAGDDGVVRLWDAATWKPLWFTRATAWAPDAQLLTHTGWHAVDLSGELVPAKPAASAWRRAVEASRGASMERGGPICVATSSGLEIWDMASDAQVGKEEIAPPFEVAALPGGCSVLREGRVTLNRPLVPPLEIATQVSSQSGGEKLSLVSSHVLLFDSSSGGLTSFGSGDAVTAAAPFGERMAIGLRNGDIELRSHEGKLPVTFQKTPGSAVTRLVSGPAGTLVAGFVDGSFAVWSASSGEMLERGAVHGAVRSLMVDRDLLLVASEVGATATLDLSLLTRDYCELLTEVWSRVPVLWREPGAIVRPPDPAHRCFSRAQPALR